MYIRTILNEVNNREIATAVWLAVALIWALQKKEIRQSFLQLFNSFVRKKIFFYFVIMIVYIIIMVSFFKNIGFWELTASKDTIFWVAGVAVTTFINLNNALDKQNFFVDFLIDNIKLIVILEFIINLYAFPLLVELIIVPIVTIAALLKGYTSGKKEFKIVEQFLFWFLGVTGIIIILFTIREIVIDPIGFANLKNFRNFLLPLIFSIAFIPYIYTMALYMMYEKLFIRIRLANNDKDLERYAIKKVIIGCNVNLPKLKKVSKLAGYPKFQSKETVLSWFCKI